MITRKDIEALEKEIGKLRDEIRTIKYALSYWEGMELKLPTWNWGPPETFGAWHILNRFTEIYEYLGLERKSYPKKSVLEPSKKQ